MRVDGSSYTGVRSAFGLPDTSFFFSCHEGVVEVLGFSFMSFVTLNPKP